MASKGEGWGKKWDKWGGSVVGWGKIAEAPVCAKIISFLPGLDLRLIPPKGLMSVRQYLLMARYLIKT